MSRRDPVNLPTYVSNTKVQSSFIGGSDTLSADTQIPENGYLWLVNGRDRFGYIDPIRRHQQITNVPKGLKQGVIAVGDVLIVFVKGFAYYQVDGHTTWIRIPNFYMNPDARVYWTCAVPASTMNFNRQADADINKPVILPTNFKISGTPAAVVVQDGVSQPHLILEDSNHSLTSREAGTFDTWANLSATLNDREYVPIGKQMVLFNGNTLLIAAPDGKSVYRSITGRPLDFMINVDTDGNKAATEAAGGAATTSFAFDYNEITCLYVINIPDSFVYGTAYNVKVITADYENTIFDEPTFKVAASIEAGIVNQHSFMEIIGDYAFVDTEGIIAFNAVQQLRFNGRNSIFSLQLAKILKGIKQTRSACINFDNYSLFSLDTTWGNITVVYDAFLQKWVSFDITEVAYIKEFAILETKDKSKLYCITEFNELFRMYSDESPTTYMAQLKTRSYIAPQTDTEHRSQQIRLLYNGATYEGTVTVIEYVDEQSMSAADWSVQLNRIKKPLHKSVAGVQYPVMPPAVPANISRVDNPVFNFFVGLTGKKLSYVIQWDNDARLLETQITTSWKKSSSSVKESDEVVRKAYANNDNI